VVPGKRALVAFIAAAAVLALLPKPAAADEEQQIGAQVYQQLLRRGEIIPSSPLYTVLNPIAQRIKTVADPQYPYPFHFILVHEKSPNAFSVPGGNVYVTDSLMHFVDNKEELAGVLCHETSHAIHHDVVHLINKDRNAELLGTLLQIFVARGSYMGQSLIGLGTGLQEQHFSRSVETAADLKGSETCAQAGFNPYGMVWLFQKFRKTNNGGTMEMLSDHPRDEHRIADLQNHFRTNPDLFGRYNDDMAKATPLKLPSEPSGPPGPRLPGQPQPGPTAPRNGTQGGASGGPYGPPPSPRPTSTEPPASQS